MNPFENTAADMPDIANDTQVEVAGKLDWVGMNEIEMPVRIEDDAGGLIQSSAAEQGQVFEYRTSRPISRLNSLPSRIPIMETG